MDFNFKNIPVYKLAETFYENIIKLLKRKKIDRTVENQLKRAALAIVLNIAEGYGRFHPKEKRYFHITSRASVDECVACLELIFPLNTPKTLLEQAISLGKMLSGLIKRFS